jgi:hypothetical protein
MNSNTVISKEAEKLVEHVTETKTFCAHIFVASICIVLLFVINLMASAYYLWAVWPLVGWGFALLAHWLTIFVRYGAFAPIPKEKTLEQVRENRLFYAHIIASIGSIGLLFVINFMTTPNYLWAVWVIVGAGFALMAHGATLLVQYGTLRS